MLADQPRLDKFERKLDNLGVASPFVVSLCFAPVKDSMDEINNKQILNCYERKK